MPQRFLPEPSWSFHPFIGGWRRREGAPQAGWGTTKKQPTADAVGCNDFINIRPVVVTLAVPPPSLRVLAVGCRGGLLVSLRQTLAHFLLGDHFEGVHADSA